MLEISAYIGLILVKTPGIGISIGLNRFFSIYIGIGMIHPDHIGIGLGIGMNQCDHMCIGMVVSFEPYLES